MFDVRNPFMVYGAFKHYALLLVQISEGVSKTKTPLPVYLGCGWVLTVLVLR
jgi:hypothetical protein